MTKSPKEIAQQKHQAKLNNNIQDDQPKELSYTQAIEIKPRPVEWLLKNHIPRGKVTLFAGEGGLGKSTWLLYLASLVSNGGIFLPKNYKFSQGNVLILSAEDLPEDTLVPRLMATGAKLENIYFLQGTKQIDKEGNTYYDSVCLDKDIFKLNTVLDKIGNVDAVFIDPITAYLGDINDYRNAEIQALYSKLTVIGEKHKSAMILNTHLAKPNGTKVSATDRVMGSKAYVNAARAAYMICKDPDNDERRLITPLKNNNGDDKTGFAYKIVPVLLPDSIETTRIELEPQPITDCANDIMNEEAKEEKEARINAKEFLMEALQFGSRKAHEIIKEAAKEGISYPTLHRARRDLKISTSPSMENRRVKIWYKSHDTPEVV